MRHIEDFKVENADILNCLKSAIIKRQKELDKFETLEFKLRFNKYRNAYHKTDTVYEHEYSKEEYENAGIFDTDIMIKLNKDIKIITRLIDEDTIELLLENKRKKIIEEYKEENKYVLTLMGKPTDEKDWVYIGYHIDGIRDDIPIHEMTDGEISILDNKGILTQIVDMHKDKDYLLYMKRRLTFYTIRTAEQFSLLYINTQDYTVGHRVAEVYEYFRIAYMRTMYNEYYHFTYHYYEALTGAYLISATLYTILSENPMSILEFDFTSDDILDALYKTFSIPYVADLPKNIRIAFAERINRVLMKKGDKSSVINIAEAFGITDIYQYILYKEYVDFENGYNPNKPIDENYKLYFVRVPIDAPDLHKYIYNIKEGDERAKIPFAEFVNADKRWGLGMDNLEEYVKKHDFSYLTTKYIGIDNVVSLVENSYTMSEFMSFLFGNKERLGDFKLKLNKPQIEVSLWEAFVYAIILIINKNGFEDRIIKDAESVVYIYGINNHIVLDEKFVDDFKSRIPADMGYLAFYKTLHPGMNITQFCDVLLHNRNALGVLRRMLREEYYDYETMRELYKLENAVGNMQINKYYGDIKNHDTYSEYLAVANAPLYTHLESIRVLPNSEAEMDEELIYLIEDLENYINPSGDYSKSQLISFLSKIKEDEAQTIKSTMFKMIAFLKTYTVDLRLSGTTYIFDDYLRILSEALIKNKVWNWSRLTTYETVTETGSVINLHSYMEIYDLFHNNDNIHRSKVRYPPWMKNAVSEELTDYLRGDYISSNFDYAEQVFFQEIDTSILNIISTLPHIYYKVNEKDIPVWEDVLKIPYFREYEDDYLNISETWDYKSKDYFFDRFATGGVVDVFKRVSPDKIFQEKLMCVDSLLCVETARVQTDIIRM